MVLLSVLLASTIAGPVRRLSEAASRAPAHHRARRYSGFHPRRDEIGHLSGALRDMTCALYSRIAAIESFRRRRPLLLKNPLTSAALGGRKRFRWRRPRRAAAPAGGDPARRAPARPV